MHEKRYRTFNEHLRKIFGCKVYKVTINPGFTCPNRDGRVAFGGCVYCNNKGFSPNDFETPIKDQIEKGKAFMRKRYKAEKFIAYFQAYTNTYAPLERLREVYDEVLFDNDIVGISIGTRPDCVPDSVLDLIASYKEKTAVWIEYGLQSIHFNTLRCLNRGHGPSEFIDAVLRTKDRNINICAHVIVGLPGEDISHIIETAKTLTALQIDSVKVHLIHILKNTLLESMFQQGKFKPLELHEYVEYVCDFLEHLSPENLIQRLTADGPKDFMLAPDWASRKFDILNAIDREMEKRGTFQGIKSTLGLRESELAPLSTNVEEVYDKRM